MKTAERVAGNRLEEPKSHRHGSYGTGEGTATSLLVGAGGRKVGDELDLRRLGHCDASERGSDATGLPVAATTTSQTCLLKLEDLRND